MALSPAALQPLVRVRVQPVPVVHAAASGKVAIHYIDQLSYIYIYISLRSVLHGVYFHIHFLYVSHVE